MPDIYSDLAVEEHERMKKGGECTGVILEKSKRTKGKVSASVIRITDHTGELRMGKPRGTYITLELPLYNEDNENIAHECAKYIKKLIPEDARTILAAGLGNASMTADALGPRTVMKLPASRGISENKEGIAVIAPGVMAQTGMESSEILEGISSKIKPDCIIAVDALAARSINRVGTTIQITDTGIAPGSGIGNKRKVINKDTIGIPVIAVGVPMVVSASAIVCDVLETIGETFKDDGENILGDIGYMSKPERHRLIEEMLQKKTTNLYVMPKDLDDMLENLSDILSKIILAILK